MVPLTVIIHVYDQKVKGSSKLNDCNRYNISDNSQNSGQTFETH